MEHWYENRKEAAIEAAARIAGALSRRLETQNTASFVASGGSSPKDCFASLSESELDWGSVHVVPSDERWVPPEHEDSNEKMLRETLLVGKAAAAKLEPFYAAGTNVRARAAELDERLRLLPFPFACALLGMGEDGHFASLFPDAKDLEAGLDTDSRRLCMAVETAASPHARLSLTLTALSRSDEIVLLIFGEAKRAVYENAKANGAGLPVTRLIKQKRAPVHVYWAP